MRLVIKLIVTVLAALGVVFLLQVAVLAYLWFADPFELRPVIQELMGGRAPVGEEGSTADVHPLLDPQQEAALTKLGVDPAALPRTLSPALMSCFRDTLGDARVDAIQGGERPTAQDFFTARACL